MNMGLKDKVNYILIKKCLERKDMGFLGCKCFMKFNIILFLRFVFNNILIYIFNIFIG